MGHGALGMGHWALGMGHWAWGMGHWVWGIGHGAWGIGHLLIINSISSAASACSFRSIAISSEVFFC
jgi:hypothetical protein